MIFSVPIHLIKIRKLVRIVAKDDAEYWLKIGSPSLFDPNGINKILRFIVFSHDGNLHSKHKNLISVVRILIVLNMSLIALVFIVGVIYSN